MADGPFHDATAEVPVTATLSRSSPDWIVQQEPGEEAKNRSETARIDR
jgi:hypothetical protein